MNSNLEKALDLAKQQKFKKALVIIKKVNQKAADVSFQTMELEALCLFKAKSYQMARIKMEKALTLSSNDREELTTLKNLAAIYEKLKIQNKVLSTLTQLVELDKGFSFVRERLSLVELALELGEHNMVKQYAPNILKFRELSIGAMICLAKSALMTADTKTALTYLTMAEGEIRSDGALIAVDKLNISMNQIILVLDGYHQLKAFSKEQSFLNFLSKKYLQHEWYQTTQKSWTIQIIKRQRLSPKKLTRKVFQ
jgi:tetratricopeptide (TPR) repeat protein